MAFAGNAILKMPFLSSDQFSYFHKKTGCVWMSLQRISHFRIKRLQSL
jgi:hypothetical protein